LNIDSVGPDQDFFELGGQSMSAVRIVAEVEKRLGVVLTARALFVNPVLSEFARAIESAYSPNTAVLHINDALDFVDSLSEEEVEHRLRTLGATPITR